MKYVRKFLFDKKTVVRARLIVSLGRNSYMAMLFILNANDDECFVGRE